MKALVAHAQCFQFLDSGTLQVDWTIRVDALTSVMLVVVTGDRGLAGAFNTNAEGQLVTGSLMDYALPRADDLPAFDIVLIERPTAANPLGVKGSGQAGCIGAPQTIMAAVLDALRPAGVTALDMPATPERILAAVERARAAAAKA